jgi:VanZ family protein
VSGAELSQKLRIILPLAYMAGLFAMSSIPAAGLEGTPGLRGITPKWQNLLHVPVFGGLALSWFWALQTRLASTRNQVRLAFAITLLYAAVDEIWQSTIPGRVGCFGDLGLDAVGAGLALWLLLLFIPETVSKAP